MKGLYPVLAACFVLVLLAVLESVYEFWKDRSARMRNVGQDHARDDSAGGTNNNDSEPIVT
jgi:hypothetical protein